MRPSRLVAAQLLGLIMGSALVVPVAGWRVATLLRERQDLMTHMAQQEASIKTLDQSLSQQTRPVVQRSVVRVQGVDEADRLQLEHNLWLKAIPGTPVRSLDGEVIHSLIDGRTIEANGKLFTVSTKVIVIGETVEVKARARLR